MTTEGIDAETVAAEDPLTVFVPGARSFAAMPPPAEVGPASGEPVTVVPLPGAEGPPNTPDGNASLVLLGVAGWLTMLCER